MVKEEWKNNFFVLFILMFLLFYLPSIPNVLEIYRSLGLTKWVCESKREERNCLFPKVLIFVFIQSAWKNISFWHILAKNSICARKKSWTNVDFLFFPCLVFSAIGQCSVKNSGLVRFQWAALAVAENRLRW